MGIWCWVWGRGSLPCCQSWTFQLWATTVAGGHHCIAPDCTLQGTLSYYEPLCSCIHFWFWVDIEVFCSSVHKRKRPNQTRPTHQPKNLRWFKPAKSDNNCRFLVTLTWLSLSLSFLHNCSIGKFSRIAGRSVDMVHLALVDQVRATLAEGASAQI